MGNQYIPTGNEFVSIPTLCQSTAGIESFTILHMGYKGMLAFTGSLEEPLFQPFITIGGDNALHGLTWTRACDWIPVFEGATKTADVQGIILAPIGQRAFAVRMTAHNASQEEQSLEMGMRGLWDSVLHCVNEDKVVAGQMSAYRSNWNDGPVFDLQVGLPVMAFAPMSSAPMQWDIENGEKIRYRGTYSCVLQPNEKVTLDIFWGVGFEEVAATTSAKELLRQSFDAVYNETLSWLSARRKTVSNTELDALLNRNLFFNLFYATGLTIDTEEAVMVTSRSPRYYVSAAYWDRDSLLWSFPSILMVDTAYARVLLDYVFTRQIRNAGIHSRYIDGTVLEPGFELDELCAPLLALSRYVDATDDMSVISEPHIEKGVRHILTLLKTKRHPQIGLYETFLQPTDDMRVYPYGTYDNVLVWRVLRDMEKLYKDLWPAEKLKLLRQESLSLRGAIEEHCIKEYGGNSIFAWSVDEEGHWDVYDEPPGSLQLLPHLGFCDAQDPIWQNTVKVLRDPSYAYSFANHPFADIGCPHAPHPWILSVANSLLCGRVSEAVDFLQRAEMDNGIACESVDEHSGKCSTGAAFATCAGFLTYCIWTALKHS